MKVPKKVWVSALVVVVVGLAVTGTLLYRQHSQEVAAERAKQKAAITGAQQLNIGRNEPDDKFTYYVNLGSTYESAGDYEKALQSFLEADQSIADKSINGTSVNITIARVYTELGNKQKAREYYQRELSRIEGSGDDEAVKAIKDLEAKL